MKTRVVNFTCFATRQKTEVKPDSLILPIFSQASFVTLKGWPGISVRMKCSLSGTMVLNQAINIRYFRLYVFDKRDKYNLDIVCMTDFDMMLDQMSSLRFQNLLVLTLN